MNETILNKLLEYIDARLSLMAAHNSSDGGLIETIHCNELRDELRELLALATKEEKR